MTKSLKMASVYKMMTLNVGNSAALGGLISILNIEKPDIVMLQEVTISSEQLSLTVARLGYSAETNIDINNVTALGTGFLWRSVLPVSEVHSVVDCRSQLLQLGKYSFLNIYAPSGSQNKQSRRLFFGQDIFRTVRGFGHVTPIIGGDFNCILSPRDTEQNFNNKKCPALKDLVDSFNYSDSYGSLNPNGDEYTFCRSNCSASRLDRFYLPPNLQECLLSVTHNASLGDHKYVVMRITLDLDKVSEPPVQCSPYWKLNTSILSDEDFLANFSTMYQKLQLKIAQYQDIACWWDLCA